MNEIEQLLQQRAGLSPEQAQQVAQEILDLLKSKVPPQFQGIVEQFLGGSSTGQDGQAAPAAGGEMGSILSVAEGFFGNKG
jgi:hypothetical protein